MRKNDVVKSAMEAFQAAVDYADKLDAGVLRNGSECDGQEKTRANGSSGPEPKRGPRPAIPIRPGS